MRIVSVASRILRWPIASRGAARDRTERAALLLEVRTDRGAIGLGEAAPLPGMSRDTLDDAVRAAAALAARAPFDLADREAAYRIATTTTAAPAAQFAIETALLDALARERQISLAAVLRTHADQVFTATTAAHVGALPAEPATGPHVGVTTPSQPDGPESIHSAPLPTQSVAHVGARSSALATAPHVGPFNPSLPSEQESIHSTLLPATDSAAHVRVLPSSTHGEQPSIHAGRLPLAAVVDDPEGARRAFAAGIRCLKIKIGPTEDLTRLFAIAQAAPGTSLRIDANRSWPRSEVKSRLAALAHLPIDYVEEPCRDAQGLLFEPLACKLALDESLALLTPDELRTALASPALAAVVLKPTLLGGLTAAFEIAELARRSGVAAIVSHGLEGPIGTAACAELALAIGGSHAAGLAVHPALAGWLVEVAQLAPDHVHPAAAPGLGFVDLDLDRVARACSENLEGGLA